PSAPTPPRALAEDAAARAIHSRPAARRHTARELQVTFQPQPGAGLRLDGIEADTLGLFVGEPLGEIGTTTAQLPAQIILFLESIWDAAEGDRTVYREEVRATLLHELGHYLGLDEIDLDERGL